MDNITVKSTPDAPEPVPYSPKQPDGRSEFLSTALLIVMAILFAFFLVKAVFQPYVVEGASMEETLHNNDRLIVWKAEKTWANVTDNNYIPERYSIVVFNKEESVESAEGKRQLIKRVIGLPGDRVIINNEVVTIYNEEFPQGFLPDQKGPQSNTITTTSGNLEYTVKNNEVFVLGDNRDNSLDSRTFGAVKAENLVGTLAVRFFPFDDVRKF